MDNVTAHFNATLKFLGYDLETGKIGINVFIYILLSIAITTDNVLLLVTKWNNMTNWILVFINILVFCVFAVYVFIYVLKWHEILSLIKVVEVGHERFPYREQSVLRKTMLRESVLVKERHTKLIYHFFQIYLQFNCLLPFISGIVIIIHRRWHHQEVNIDSLPLPYPFYYPNYLKSVLCYYVIFLLEIFHIKLLIGYGFVTYASSFNAMHFITNEIKLLRLTLTEMPLILGEKNNDCCYQHFEQEMKCYFRYIVKYHQSIYRKMHVINRVVHSVSASFNFGITLYVCATIYYIVQNDDTVMEIILAFSSIVSCWLLYMFCINGENIITEDDNLRKALYECSWVDKPQWVKTTLNIAMTRSKRPIELKPFGLFVLNLKNFATAMKTAYSYYNILNSFNRK